MKAAIYPDNENIRVNELRSLNILDTDAEERFDRVTRLAKNLFNVPIAVVSLVEDERQWFKSKQGLDATETPRQISFCGHTILDSEILIVNDTLNDNRFYDNPLVLNAPHIRFYAGCPLEPKTGLRLGTLCLIDNQPRSFLEKDKLILKDLTKMVESELYNASLATTDELTGLSNRRGFMELSNYFLKCAKREKKESALFYMDLDNFKKINDQFGHHIGDEALIETSKILLNSFRGVDVIGRMGGDEFCILCSITEPEQINTISSRLSASFESFNKNNNKKYKIQCSIGSTLIPADNIDCISASLLKADQAMYNIKQRN